MMKRNILVIDDEEDIRNLITDILEDEGYSVNSASSSLEAFESINDRVPSVIILDIWLQGSELDGLGILEIIAQKFPYVPVVMISGHGTIETAIKSLKMGAYDYLEKPFSENKLVSLISRAAEASKLMKENDELRYKLEDHKELIGSSKEILKLKSAIEKVSLSSSRILITGQSGSGKQLAAKQIHLKSKRKSQPFVIFNPSGKDSDTACIELFGDDSPRGIHFQPRKVGLLEIANNGTLLIEDIENLQPNLQNKLLIFLQDNIIHKSSNKTLKLDVRIISSSSKDLNLEIQKGNLRKDLYYRINVIPLEVPPLSERRQDIPLIADYFLKQLCKKEGYGKIELSQSALSALQAYDWPGNIRQLRNSIEWILIMNANEESSIILPSMLPSEIVNSKNQIQHPQNNFDLVSMNLKQAREVFETQYLTTQLQRFNGNISKMSKFVGMERSALHRKLKSLDIVSHDEK